jgi:hypothetical protein
MHRPRRAFIAAFLLLAQTPAPARAEDPAAAQALFAEGRQLVAQGRVAEACTKLAESERLDPGIGTLFHLADCYERLGRTASAWAAYLDVAAQARATGQPAREKVARDRAAALAPSLSHLTIDVRQAARVPGLEVRRDGVDVRANGASASIQVPLLHDETSAPRAPLAAALSTPPPPAAIDTAKPAPESADGHAMSPRRVAALAMGGVAVIALAVGGVTTGQALSRNSSSNADGHCVGDRCDATGVQLRDDARSAGNVATVAFVAAGVLAAAGVTLWASAPTPSSHVALSAYPGGAALHGSF